MKKIGVISLGCPKNLVDSEVMLGLARQKGWEITALEDSAEVLLINTCCFIKPAEDEAYAEIRRAAKRKQRGELKGLIVSGCLPQRYSKQLAQEFPQVDCFLGTGNFDQLPQILKGLSEAGDNNGIVGAGFKPARKRPGAFLYDHTSPRMLATGNIFAYSKIAEGCSRCCSFCIVPKLRGKLKSRPTADILAETKQLAEQGIVELNLVAQDLTAYGTDLKGRADLAALLLALEQNPTPAWIRLLYNYPENFSDELIEILASAKKILPYLDLPLQHSETKILTAMRRQVTRDTMLHLLAKLRKNIPGLTLRTTLLVGFPGEGDKEFRALCDFVRQQQFDRLGVFPYSREEGTAAAKMPQQLPEEEKIQRAEEIMKIQAEIVEQKQRQAIGRQLAVLVLGNSGRKDYPLYGRGKSQAPDIDGVTFIRGKDTQPGTIVTVEQAGFEEHDILASGQTGRPNQ